MHHGGPLRSMGNATPTTSDYAQLELDSLSLSTLSCVRDDQRRPAMVRKHPPSTTQRQTHLHLRPPPAPRQSPASPSTQHAARSTQHSDAPRATLPTPTLSPNKPRTDSHPRAKTPGLT
ncbi:hypothetical protein PMIN03_002175 [Paraphaeosphaeria minitans]